MAALWIVGVRDWRVYGAASLWGPVIGEMRTAHLTLILCLLLAIVWRARARTAVAGLTLGVIIGLKFFLWPLVLWLASTRRWREACIAVATAAASLLLLLTSIGIADYVRVLRFLGDKFDQTGYSPYSLLVQAGAPHAIARARVARDRRRGRRVGLAPAQLRAVRRLRAAAVADRLARLLRGARRSARRRPPEILVGLARPHPHLRNHVGRRGRSGCRRRSGCWQCSPSSSGTRSAVSGTPRAPCPSSGPPPRQRPGPHRERPGRGSGERARPPDRRRGEQQPAGRHDPRPHALPARGRPNAAPGRQLAHLHGRAGDRRATACRTTRR